MKKDDKKSTGARKGGDKKTGVCKRGNPMERNGNQGCKGEKTEIKTKDLWSAVTRCPNANI